MGGVVVAREDHLPLRLSPRFQRADHVHALADGEEGVDELFIEKELEDQDEYAEAG
jgi:hypothetical protein